MVACSVLAWLKERQKLLYLPEGHTDFVLALVGEELGLIGNTRSAGALCGVGGQGVSGGRASP